MDDETADGSGAMFDRIAARYDRLNRIMSLGMDRRWRRAAAKALALDEAAPPGDEGSWRVLDVATGTGDLALDILARTPRIRVDGLDPATQMLEVARQKVSGQAALSERLELHEGTAEALPFEDDTFDGATIAFGIRNVADRKKALRELMRVVRPGRRVVVLELVEPRGFSPVAVGAKVWVHAVVPMLGAMLSSRREYRYLQQSIQAFPPPEGFAGLMRWVGLTDVGFRKLGFGSVALFTGTVAAE